MRSGTFVGPGTKRKLRPAIRGIAVSFENGREKQSENPRLSLKLHQHRYSAPPAPHPQPHGRVGETVLSEGKSPPSPLPRPLTGCYTGRTPSTRRPFARSERV